MILVVTSNMCAYPFIKLMEAAEPIRDFEITLSAIGKNLESLRIILCLQMTISQHIFRISGLIPSIFSLMKNTELK